MLHFDQSDMELVKILIWGFISYQIVRMRGQGARASEKVEAVRMALIESAEVMLGKTESLATEKTLQKTAEAIEHEAQQIGMIAGDSKASKTYLNAEKGQALREKVADKRRIVELSGNDPAAQRALELAEQELASHEASQIRVDSDNQESPP